MQACVYEEYGPPEVVKVTEVATPVVKAGGVLVRVRAAAVTTADWRFRASVFPKLFWLPGRLMMGLFRPRNRVLGMDFSGVVEGVGPGVSRFRPGDAVFGSSSAWSRGAHAEYVVIKESDAVIHKPAALTDQDAAAIPFGANTAFAFMRDFAALRGGQRILVIGASGSVGVWAVQIARHLGAEVTGVASSPNLELVRALGAHHVVDYAAGPLAPNGETYDVVFDTVGVTSFASSRRMLEPQGLYLPLNTGVREMVQHLLRSRGRGQRVKWAISENSRESLELTASLIADGTLRPVVDRVYPMARIAEAHRHVESRHKRGAVIVAMPT